MMCREGEYRDSLETQRTTYPAVVLAPAALDSHSRVAVETSHSMRSAGSNSPLRDGYAHNVG